MGVVTAIREAVGLAPKKRSSPEISSLAGSILRIPVRKSALVDVEAYNALLRDAKRLAASVLSQDETKGQ